MRKWLKKLRGLLGLGLTGAVLGGIFGVLWWVGETLFGFGSLAIGSLGWAVGLWSGFGAFATTGAGLLLATVGAPTSIRELKPGRVAAFGALMGLLAPLSLIVVVGVSWSPELAMVAGISAVMGGIVGGGLVAAAKRSEHAELPAIEDPRAVGPGG